MKYINLLVFAILLLNSCDNGTKKEIQTMHEKVMEVHDGVMTRMDDIHNLKKELSKSLADTKDSTEIMDAIKKLDDADEAMMVWMEEFNAEYTTMKAEEQKQYLNGEMDKINKVSEVMLASIDYANQLLSKSKPLK